MSKVTPRDREEKLLAAIAEGATGELPTPRNRKESRKTNNCKFVEVLKCVQFSRSLNILQAV